MGKRKRQGDEEEETIPPAKEGQCHYWVKRKRRYCHLGVKPGNKYCGQHAVLEEETGDRIPCPYDPNHNVAKDNLKKHLKKCNNRPKPLPPYHVEDINIGHPQNANTTATSTPRKRLEALSPEEFNKLAEKIRELYAKVLPVGKDDFDTVVLAHPAMAERLDASHGGKHAVQQASILGHMDRLGLLNENNVFIEFGCGKGELSNWISVAMGENSKFVLIDRRNFRQKHDATIRYNQTTGWIERLSMDIKNLDLTHYDKLQNSPAVGVSKHLCGSATDITLRCIGRYVESGGDVAGVVIALCCHQICKYGMYIDPGYLVDCGIGREEFELMCVMSTWAVCGTREGKTAAEQEENAKTESVGQPNTEQQEPDEEQHTLSGINAADQQQDGEHWSGLTFPQRKELGVRCKRILDHGRVQYLRKLGFVADLVYYVGKDKSLENLALVARRRIDGNNGDKESVL